MIKVATPETIILGVEEENLNRLLADNPIRFNLDDITALEMDCLIVFQYTPKMMKFMQKRHPRDCIVMNLPIERVNFLQENGVLKFNVKEYLTKDMFIFYEKTMNDLMKLFSKGIGPDTVLDNKIKS